MRIEFSLTKSARNAKERGLPFELVAELDWDATHEIMPGFIEAMDEFRRKLGRPKAEAPKVHIGFRLASDVVASIKASGRGYNARVEQALRAAGFGGKDKRELSKRGAAAKKRSPIKQGRSPPSANDGREPPRRDQAAGGAISHSCAGSLWKRQTRFGPAMTLR